MTQITSVPFHGTNILTDKTLPRIIQPADVRDGDRIAAEFEDGWETVIANGPRMLRTPRCIVLLERPEPEPVWPTDECIYITDGETRDSRTTSSHPEVAGGLHI